MLVGSLVLHSSGGVFGVVAYVDASYGAHLDYRSHTGLVFKVGGATIIVQSSKQKIDTSSRCFGFPIPSLVDERVLAGAGICYGATQTQAG
jgi:hypothetical protein